MGRYVGLDVHERFIEVCILDGKGNVLYRGRTDCDRPALVQFGKLQLKKTDQVALEATTNTWPVVEILRPFVKAIVGGNPLKTKAIQKPRSRRTRWMRKSWRCCCDVTTCPMSGSRMIRRKHSAA